MRIISWNVNGLRAICKKGFIETVRSLQPDILCLQETKVTEEQWPAELAQLDGYTSYLSAAERKGYSGVAIFTNTPPLTVTREMGIPEFDSEGRVLIAEYPEFILSNVYFPNGKASAERLRYKMAFYDAYLEQIDRWHAAGKRVIVCGDVNTAHQPIDLARPKENEKSSGFLPEERAWIDRLLSHGMLDTFRAFHVEPEQYTWWDMKTRARDRNIGWRIDYFFASQTLHPHLTDARHWPDIMGSDHCPIGVDLQM